MSTVRALVLALAVSSARAHPGFLPNLNPVHSLFVQPSEDGSTGDLYVAATEDNGVKSQWITDQPVNFLSAQHQHPVLSGLTAAAASQHDDSIVKRAAVTSPAFKYAYAALPGATSADSNVVPYSYPAAVATAQPIQTEGNNAETPAVATPIAAPYSYPQYQYQSPFQYYYPQMMSTFANAINELKEAGVSEEDANSLISQIMPQTTPMWPSAYSYPAYPVQYVMVDPATWAQSQALATATQATPTTTTTATITASSEETA